MSYDNLLKNYVRDYISIFLKKSNVTSFLSLSNLNFDLEKIALKKKASVYCCENKIEVFRKQKLIAPKKVKLLYGDIKEYVHLREYDFVWLDFCGNINYGNISCIENLSLRENSTVIITFLLARENKETQEIIDISNREFSITKVLKRLGLYTFEIVKYNASKSPMAVFFTKNIKTTNEVEVKTLKI